MKKEKIVFSDEKRMNGDNAQTNGTRPKSSQRNQSRTQGMGVLYVYLYETLYICLYMMLPGPSGRFRVFIYRIKQTSITLF